ncbi:MAG: TrkA family potassium uptake protein [Clostridia bacterium]|nr:TrkA family potassium uptake protein [Clostridia bacterium]MBR6810004.1 TrkA family potassium uptake protein [Clostridia bacterium]
MSIHKTYAVFGLGRYGSAVALELVQSGAEVLAVDADPDIVNAFAEKIPLCKCADVTDPAVIRQLGISNIDVVIIAMAQELEASVMAVMLCKEAGVPKVIAKCSSEMHRQILQKVGADIAVLPESESGTRMARNLLSSGFLDIFELSSDVAMVEVEVKDEWVGKTIRELNLRRRFDMNIVAVCQGENVNISIDPEMSLGKDMRLVVIAHTDRLSRLS